MGICVHTSKYFPFIEMFAHCNPDLFACVCMVGVHEHVYVCCMCNMFVCVRVCVHVCVHDVHVCKNNMNIVLYIIMRTHGVHWCGCIQCIGSTGTSCIPLSGHVVVSYPDPQLPCPANTVYTMGKDPGRLQN